MPWRPMSEAQLWDEINAAEGRMSKAQRRLWEMVRILPERWAQHPYGDRGKGFWVVGIIGRLVVWFNDIEGGFNHSIYRQYGVIDEYFSNQDNLDVVVQQLLSAIELGYDMGPQLGPPVPID